MNVNENCKAVPYVLGRMFAVLEGLQQDSSEVSATSRTGISMRPVPHRERCFRCC